MGHTADLKSLPACQCSFRSAAHCIHIDKTS